MHTRLSGGVPLTTRHEARSKEEKTAAKVKALEEGLTRKTVRIRIQKRGGRPRAGEDREKSHPDT